MMFTELPCMNLVAFDMMFDLQQHTEYFANIVVHDFVLPKTAKLSKGHVRRHYHRQQSK